MMVRVERKPNDSLYFVTLEYGGVTIRAIVENGAVVGVELPEPARRAILESPVEALWLAESLVEAVKASEATDPFTAAVSEFYESLELDKMVLSRRIPSGLRLAREPKTVEEKEKVCWDEYKPHVKTWPMTWSYMRECTEWTVKRYDAAEAEEEARRLEELRMALIHFLQHQ